MIIFNLNEYTSIQELIMRNIKRIEKEDMCVVMDQTIHLDSPSQKIGYMEGNFVGLMSAQSVRGKIIFVGNDGVEEYNEEGLFIVKLPTRKENIPENIRLFMMENVIPKMITETREIIKKMEKGMEEEEGYVGVIFVKDKKEFSELVDFLIKVNRGDEGPEKKNLFDGKPVMAFKKEESTLMGIFLIVKEYLVIMEAGKLGSVLNKEGLQVDFTTFLKDLLIGGE